jgi:cell division protease FtsH
MRSAAAHDDGFPDAPAPGTDKADGTPPVPPDPGLMLACWALRRAAGRRSLVRLRESNHVVLLAVPSGEWVAAVAAAWQEQAWAGLKPAATLGDVRERYGRERRRWAVLKTDEMEAFRALRSHAREYAEAALLAGLPLTLVSADPGALPPELRAAVDLTLTLRPLPWAHLCQVAHHAAAPDKARMAPARAAVLDAVTPTVMRLASRPGQTASALLGKALALAAARLPELLATVTPARGALDRLPGLGAATVWGRQLAADLAGYRQGSLAWADIDRGVLLSGPPGCGKTAFARALAAEAGVPLIAASYSEWQASGEAHLECLLKAMRSSFAQARKAAPCILFIDEADSFPNRAAVRHAHADYVRSFVNALLAELDGAGAREGVVVVGACNDPAVIDPALLRSGRLDRHIRIPLPGAEARAAILRVHLCHDLAGADLATVIEMSAGRTGADIERWCREARRAARLARRQMLLADLEDAALEGGRDERSPQQRWRHAVHEAGHAVMATLLRPGSVRSVSIRNSGTVGGTSEHALPAEDSVSDATVGALVAEALAGRAAEETLLGSIGAGAGGGERSDLAKATWLCAIAAASLGLDDAGGLLWQGLPAVDEVPAFLLLRPDLASRVRARLDAAYGEARALVAARRDAVLAVAKALTEVVTLPGERVTELVERWPGKEDATGCHRTLEGSSPCP